MKQVGKWWFPESEQHMIPFIERDGVYQEKHRRTAMKWVKQKRTVIDIGAHVGLWSRDFSRQFVKVEAFEPVAEFRECYIKNVIEWPGYKDNVTLYPYALGNHEGFVSMDIDPVNTGHTHVNLDKIGDENDVELKKLDSFDFQDVDYIKIDAESFEEYIVRGGEQTILKWKPVISIEQKDHKFYESREDFHGQYGAMKFLKELGMYKADFYASDLVMKFPD